MLGGKPKQQWMSFCSNNSFFPNACFDNQDIMTNNEVRFLRGIFWYWFKSVFLLALNAFNKINSIQNVWFGICFVFWRNLYLIFVVLL